jgi:hypothetical protein
MTRLQVLLLEHDANAGTHKQAITEAFAAAFDLTCHSLDQHWPAHLDEIADARRFDAIIWKPKFRLLATRTAFDWRGYDGLRVLYDLDTIQNYSTIVGSTYLGAWPRVFAQHRFDLLVSTGRELTWRLCDDGVPTVWVPKGFDSARITPGPTERAETACTYGDAYVVRKRMMRALAGAGLSIPRIACPYDALPSQLHRFAACIICNMDLVGADRLPLRVLEHLPAALPLERCGLEPMIKNFEAAGAGCTPVCDAIPELEALGFVHGQTMLAYRSFRELRTLLADTDKTEFARIGQAAAALVHKQHTWRHRAGSLEQELRNALANQRA